MEIHMNFPALQKLCNDMNKSFKPTRGSKSCCPKIHKNRLTHISQKSGERVENVIDKLPGGDMVKVKVLGVDKQGRVRLSMKAVNHQ